MSLYSLIDYIPAYYFVCVINSFFISLYVDNFVNNTQTFQINDSRQLPIIIPTEEQLKSFRSLFNMALQIKKQRLNNFISKDNEELQLSEIQNKLDKMVNALYGI